MGVVEEIRAKVQDRLGDGGIRSISRRFRIMDNDGNRMLDAEELKYGFADCGVDLTSSELSALMSLVDKNGDRNLSVSEFLRIFRGSLPKCREVIVAKAWKKLDKTGDNKVTVADLIGKYDASRHPLVIKGEKTEQDILEDFLKQFGSNDEVLTSEEFVDYYTGVSSNIDDHNHFVLLVTNAWRLDQPEKGPEKQKLAAEISKGFQRSSFKGVDGSLEPPLPEEKVQAKDNLRFATMISNNLDPFPLPKPGNLPKGVGSASYATTSPLHHKAKCFRGGNEVASEVPPFEGEKSMTGKVANGMRDSRGFLETTTAFQRGPGTGTFDDQVQQVHKKWKDVEEALLQERTAIKTAPFETAEPGWYVRSTMEHANLLKAVEREEPLSAQRSLSRQTDKKDLTTQEELREIMMKARESEKPHTVTKKTSALSWTTTAHDHFSEYDCKAAEDMNSRFGTMPIPPKTQQLTEQDREALIALDARKEQRFNGRFETTTHLEMRDKSREVETQKANHRRGVFSLRNGVPQILPASHHPRPVASTEQFTTSQIVPGQFTSMSTHVLQSKQ